MQSTRQYYYLTYVMVITTPDTVPEPHFALDDLMPKKLLVVFASKFHVSFLLVLSKVDTVPVPAVWLVIAEVPNRQNIVLSLNVPPPLVVSIVTDLI